MQDPPESEALRAENARRTQAMRELAVELAHDDPALPVPLDWSDKGPGMTSSPTREFMALMAIWQHHGRPHTPTDRPHIAARPVWHASSTTARRSRAALGNSHELRGFRPRFYHELRNTSVHRAVVGHSVPCSIHSRLLFFQSG